MLLILIIVLLGVILLAALVFLATRQASNKAADLSEAKAQSMAFMDDCEGRVKAMQRAHKEYSQSLNALCELIMYSDKSGTTEIDWKVDAVLTRLEIALSSEDGEDIPAVLEETKDLFNRRKEEIRALKRGAF
ncbi:MAG: hypothetical protein FWE42_03700 [Defluviitaleaceae bacterium]|nr:hypothetical protein [Defluviitaleaceae bacterium]